MQSGCQLQPPKPLKDIISGDSSMVKVYVASIDSLLVDDYFKLKEKSVSQERKKKMEACRMKKDKARSLAAGLLLQYAWNSDRKTTEKVEISFGDNGKPVCSNDESFHFNLSHSGEFVACAVSEEIVGIDIQKEKTAELAIAKRFFMPEEYETILRASKEEQARIFCKLWTAKESYMKYTGEGMSKRMNSFLVNMKDAFIYDEIDRIVIPVRWYTNIADYQIAVCSLDRELVEEPIRVVL